MCADNIKYFPFDFLKVIPYKKYSGIRNMSLDYLLALNCAITNIPVLRFYGWKPHCLSLGRHQLPEEIDLAKLRSEGFDVVKRPTGGSAIFHSEELTYSFLVPGKKLHHQKIYQFFHEQLKKALRNMGVNVILQQQGQPYRLNRGQESFACFNRSAFSELQVGGKKIIGSAQKILKNGLLQHGSILLGKEHRRIIDFLRIEKSQKGSLFSLLEEKSTELSSVIRIMPSIDTLTELILNEFRNITDLKIITDLISIKDIRESEKFDKVFSLTT